MLVVVSGASGLIGGGLVRGLLDDGHEVRRLVRRPARSPEEREWHPEREELPAAALADADAVVHLAGANIGDRRLTAPYKREILASRVDSTALIARTMAVAGGPMVLVCASATGYYGDTGAAVVDESAPRGEGFLAHVVEQWEGAAAPAVDAGVRVAFARMSLVLTRNGGALSRMLPLFRYGVGGPLGSGQQWWPWVAYDDALRALRYLLEEDLRGPVNVTAPEAVTNAEMTRALAQVMHRPAFLRVPAFALRLVLGELADQGVLLSQRVTPARLMASGFTFRWPDLQEWLAHEVAA